MGMGVSRQHRFCLLLDRTLGRGVGTGIRHSRPRGDTGCQVLVCGASHGLPPLLIAQGRGKEARDLLASFAGFSVSADQQERGSYEAAHMIVLRAEGKLAETLGLAEAVIEREVALGPRFPGLKVAFVEGAEIALARGDWPGRRSSSGG